jgi:hypothetical protein
VKKKQYIVSALGVRVAVSFTPAEEKRVRAKAAKLGTSVEDLIVSAIDRVARSARNANRSTDEVVTRAVAFLGEPTKRKASAR